MANHANEGEENIEAGEDLGEADIARSVVVPASRPNLDIREDSREYKNRISPTNREAFALTSDDHDDERENYLRENVKKKPHDDWNPGSVQVYSYIFITVEIQLPGS